MARTEPTLLGCCSRRWMPPLGGIASNLEYLRQITRWQRFVSGDVATQALNIEFAPNAMEVVVAGTYTTVQDYPDGWAIGT